MTKNEEQLLKLAQDLEDIVKKKELEKKKLLEIGHALLKTAEIPGINFTLFKDQIAWRSLVEYMRDYGEEKCDCKCHCIKGHFHCWTGPCCPEVDVPFDKLTPAAVRYRHSFPDAPFVMDANKFKSFTFPMIKQPFPNLVNEDFLTTQPMPDKKDPTKEEKG